MGVPCVLGSKAALFVPHRSPSPAATARPLSLACLQDYYGVTQLKNTVALGSCNMG